MTELARYAELAGKVAREAGALLRSRPREVHHKGRIDLVTEVDLASERLIRDTFAGLTPEIPVFGEETGGPPGGLRWVVDPLDGTTNFVHDYPGYTVSIALCEGDEPLAGAVYDPQRDHLYTGARGAGARLGDEPLRVSTTPDLLSALCVTGFPPRATERFPAILEQVRRVLAETQGLRRSGSAAFDLCTIARGGADLYWELGLAPWDTAAGAVLVREAGGVVTRLEGTPWSPSAPSVLATNARLHEAAVRLLTAP